MEQQITFGTTVSVRVRVAMPGQPRGQVLIVEWGPHVDLLVRLGRYELVEVMSPLPEPTTPEPQPQPQPQPEPEPDPESNPAPPNQAPAEASPRRRSRS